MSGVASPSLEEEFRLIRHPQADPLADEFRSIRATRTGPSQLDQTVEPLAKPQEPGPSHDERDEEPQAPYPVGPVNAVGVPTRPSPRPRATGPVDFGPTLAETERLISNNPEPIIPDKATMGRGRAVTATFANTGRELVNEAGRTISNLATGRASLNDVLMNPDPQAGEPGVVDKAMAASRFGPLTPSDVEGIQEQAAQAKEDYPLTSFLTELGTGLTLGNLDPKNIAAMMIAHVPAGATMNSTVVQGMLGALSKKAGPRVTDAVESILHAQVGTGMFAGVRATMEPGATFGSVTKETAGGALLGTVIGAPGALIDPVVRAQQERRAALIADRHGETANAANALRHQGMQAGTNVDRPGEPAPQVIDPKRERAEAERAVGTPENINAVRAMSDEELTAAARQVRAVKGVPLNVRRAQLKIIQEEQAARQSPQGPGASQDEATPPQPSGGPDQRTAEPTQEPLPTPPLAREQPAQEPPAVPSSGRTPLGEPEVAVVQPSPQSTIPEPPNATPATGQEEPAAPAQEPPAAEQAGAEGAAAGGPAGQPPVRQAVQGGEAAGAPAPEPVKPDVRRWVRGVREGNAAINDPGNAAKGDRFYSTDRETAANFTDPGVPKLERLAKADRPTNPLRVDTKEDLAETIGYTGEPRAEPLDTPEGQKFDTLARQHAIAGGHDAIIYESGTFDQPEMHLFGKEPPPPKAQVTGSTEAQVRAVKARADAQEEAKAAADRQLRRVAARQRDARNPPEYRKSDVEKRIIEHAERVKPSLPDVLDEPVEVAADGTMRAAGDHWSGTFLSKIPSEIAEQLDLKGADANLRKYFTTLDPNDATSTRHGTTIGGPDAFANLERHRPGMYVEVLRAIADRPVQPTPAKIAQAKLTGKKLKPAQMGMEGSRRVLEKVTGADPHSKFLLWLHDRLETGDPTERPDWEMKTTGEIPEGSKLKIAGEEFTAHKNEWGVVRLKDGVEIDATATESVPMDKGTLEAPKGKDATEAAQEARRANRKDRGLLAKARKMDPDEWDAWREKDPETAHRIGIMLENEHADAPDFNTDDLPKPQEGAGAAGSEPALPEPGAEGKGTAGRGVEAVDRAEAPAGEAKPPKPKRGKLGEVADALKSEADKVSQRMSKRAIPRGKNAGAALPPEHLADAALWLTLKMGEYTARGIEATVTLARRLVDEFRPELSPHFAAVYGEALRLRIEHDSAVSRGDEPPKAPTAAPTGRTPSADVTGPANAITDARRADLNLPDRDTPAGRMFESMLDAGQRMKTGDANAGPALLKRMGKDRSYIVDHDEQGLLTLHMVDQENTLTRRIDAVEAATKTGDPAQVRHARLLLADHVATMGEEFDLINQAGTAAGRALVSRKLLADMNYSLVSYAAKIQGDIGRALTPEELTTVKKETDAYKQRAAEVEVADKGLRERLAQAESVSHFAEAQRQAAEQGRLEAEAAKREAEKNAVPPYLKERFDKWKAKAKTAGDESAAWLKKNVFANAGLNPEQLYHSTRWGVARMAEGLITLAEWSTAAVVEFGEGAKPHLHEAFFASEKEFKKQVNHIGMEPDEVVRKVRKPKDGTIQPVKPKPKSTIDKMRARAAEGAPLTDLQRYLRARELEMIRDGIDSREQVIGELHADVTGIPEFKDVTPEEVRDLLSGYGEFRELDPESAKKTQRQWRQENMKLGQLRDLSEGKFPKATGIERESPSDTARRLQAEVNEAKKKAGLDPNAGPGSLKTLVQTQTTRLKNRIADIKTELDTGTRIVNRRPVKISTPEIESLRKEFEVLDAAHKAMFKKPDPTDAELLEGAVNAAKLHADLWAQKVKDAKAGKFRDESTKKQFKDPRIEAFEAQAEALREEHEALKKADPKEIARAEAAKMSAATKAAERAYAKMVEVLANAENKGEFKAPPGKGRLTPTIESLRRQTDALRERYHALKAADPGQQRVLQDRLNQQYRAQVARKMADNAERIAKGDLEPRVNAKKLIDDKQTRIARMRYEDQVRTLHQLRDRMREQNKHWLSKGLDWVPGQLVQWSVLTWPTTVVKLAAAAVSRMGFTPIEQGFGLGLSKAMPDLARYAPRQGAPTARTLLAAEGDALIGLATGTRDAKYLLKGQATPLMRSLGKERLPPLKRDWIRYALHASIKNPILESEFRRSLTLRVDHALRNGVDVTDPFERHRLMSEAYQDAKRALFLQDNALVSAFQGFIARGVKTAEKAGHETAASLLSRWAQAELPIVKIPTNIVAEALEHIFGLAIGGGRAAYWYKAGIENLKDQPIVADAILRQLKKGSVGAAVGLLGLAYYNHAGGFHVKGIKQDQDEGKVGEIAGIPAMFLHSPQAEVFQFYATVRKMLNRQIKKSSGDEYGLTTAAIASFMGLIGDVPFVKEMGLFDQIEDPKTANDALAKDWLGKTIPGLVQFPAAYFDREPHPPGFWGWYNAERVRRDPHGWTETAESMLPGLRGNVPTKEENAAASKAQQRYYRQSHPAARKE